MDTIATELRLALRRLGNAPAFSAVVLITLALGIGANTAIFSVVNAMLLRPLPYREPERLVAMQHDYPSTNLKASISVPGFRDYRDRTHSFTGVAVEVPWDANLTGAGDPERLRGVQVSGAFFSTMGVTPALGRALLTGEDEAGHDHVVVLSDGAWKRLFGGERSAIGRHIALNGEPYEVVGVMPPSFRDFFRPEAQLWSPVAFRPEQFSPTHYTDEFLSLVARLAPGVTLAQAQAEMRGLAEHLKKDYPDRFPNDWSVAVTPLTTLQTGDIRPALFVLLGAVGFVLLIACANVANLLLARAAARRRDLAIRTALGASRRDLVRQMLAESLLLSTGGGVLGLLLAAWGVRALGVLRPGRLPRVDEVSIDGSVLLFTAVVALATGVLFGLAPLLQTTSFDLHSTLKEGGRGGTAERSGQRMRGVLVMAEVALALTLLTGAGLLIKSFARLQGVNPGFDPDAVLTFTLSLPQSKYPSDTARAALFVAAAERLSQIPGVRAAGATSTMPFSGETGTASFSVEGYHPASQATMPWGDLRVTTPSFLAALRVPLVTGRYLSVQDGPGTQPVVVVDEELVRRYLPRGEDPIGRRLWFGATEPNDSTRYLTIVGVVGHTKQEELDGATRPQIYLPSQQSTSFGRLTMMDFALRTGADPRLVVGGVRRALHELDPDLPIANVSTLSDMMDASLGQRRLSMVLLGVFASIALLLSAVGIYGLMSYSVAQRTRELGVRMALGARQRDVLKLVVRQGMRMVFVGIGVGLLGALVLTRLMTSQLYAVRATDPASMAGAAALLLGSALLAIVLPARRAARVDPLTALRATTGD